MLKFEIDEAILVVYSRIEGGLTPFRFTNLLSYDLTTMSCLENGISCFLLFFVLLLVLTSSFEV